MLNVLDNKPLDLHLYYQYRDNEALEEYFDLLHSFISEYYFSFLSETIMREQSAITARTDYITFWFLNLFGLYRPLGAAALNVFYDIEERYDNQPPLTYDDAQSYDGSIDLIAFKQYILFLLNYSNEVINLHTLTSFCQNWCKFKDMREITLDLSFDGITIKIPTTQQSGEFLKLLRAYYNELGLPYGINIDVRYKDAALNKTLGIV